MVRSRNSLVFIVFAALAALSSAADLSWSDNSDNEDGFIVERAEEGGEFLRIAIVPADVNKYSDLHTKLGVEYQYRVNAFNAFGYSGYTNVSIFKEDLPVVDDIEQGTPPASPGDTLTASKLAKGLEAFASALRAD